MTDQRQDYVVDASVGIKLFVVEELSDQARLVFTGLAADPPARLHVPDLFYSECANILWKYVRRFGYPADSARRSLTDLGALPLRRVSTAELVADALDLALAHDITAYDACYVALSDRLGVPLITADQALVRKLVGAAVAVQWLGELGT